MKNIKDLTPEIEAKIPQYIERYTRGIFDGQRFENFKKEDAEKLIFWNYEKCGFKRPVVLVAENPYEAQIFFNYIKLNQEIFAPILYLNYCIINDLEIPKEFNFSSQLSSQLSSQISVYNYDYLFTSNIWSNGLVAWYKFIKDEFNIDAEINIMLDSWSDLYQNSNVYSSIFSELVCVVSKYPKKIHRNINNDLHNTNGSSVEWNNSTDMTNFDCYYVNGRNINKELFKKVNSKEFTFEDFKLLSNEDEKAAVLTIIKENEGNVGLMKFLNAICIDEKIIKHENGYSETIKLFQTKEKFDILQNSKGEFNQPYAWINMKCPSTGSEYLIDTCPTFTDVLKCAKWHRPKLVPDSVDYIWTSAN